jgi:hypothetical protein
MAQNKFALARYCMIDNLLNKHEYVKTAYIAEICRRKLKCSITQRTIQMDIDAMRNDSFLGYFAPIEYCPAGKRTIIRTLIFDCLRIAFLIKRFPLCKNYWY